jgi:hypothetical protein
MLEILFIRMSRFLKLIKTSEADEIIEQKFKSSRIKD